MKKRFSEQQIIGFLDKEPGDSSWKFNKKVKALE